MKQAWLWRGHAELYVGLWRRATWWKVVLFVAAVIGISMAVGAIDQAGYAPDWITDWRKQRG